MYGVDRDDDLGKCPSCTHPAPTILECDVCSVGYCLECSTYTIIEWQGYGTPKSGFRICDWCLRDAPKWGQYDVRAFTTILYAVQVHERNNLLQDLTMREEEFVVVYTNGKGSYSAAIFPVVQNAKAHILQVDREMPEWYIHFVSVKGKIIKVGRKLKRRGEECSTSTT